MADEAGKKAELKESETLLRQATVDRPAPAAGPAPEGDRERLPSQAELRDAVEVMEAQLQGKQAELRGEDVKVARANTQLADLKAAGVELQPSYRDAKADIEAARAAQEVKKAEVLEYEVRLKQARRRVEANEGRLRREAERAKSRLEWAEDMLKKGFVGKSQYEADRLKYVELMIQLDPSFVPPKPAGVGP